MSLSDIAVKNAKPKEKPYKMGDSGGLYVFVNITGSRYWRMDYRFAGKHKTVALGVYPAISLAAARKRRDEAREKIASGIDPAMAKKEAKREARYKAAITFEAIAREWLDHQRARWTENYAGHVLRRLEADIFPAIGLRPIAEIEAPELLDALRKIEARGVEEMARRMRQTCGQIFRYAVATGRARRDPSADLKGALKPRGRADHHKAMPKTELPCFLKALSTYDGDPRTKYALQLMILTFVRTSELRGARWEEFEDLDGASPLWRIPAARMKMRSEHLVPLSSQAVAVLKELKPLCGNSAYLFPSPSKEKVMSNNTMLYALYRMGYHGRATVHGFRGLASTTLNEMGFKADWIERQLAHDERNKVRAAYNHAQYLSERRDMMQKWADYLDRLTVREKAVSGRSGLIGPG